MKDPRKETKGKSKQARVPTKENLLRAVAAVTNQANCKYSVVDELDPSYGDFTQEPLKFSGDRLWKTDTFELSDLHQIGIDTFEASRIARRLMNRRNLSQDLPDLTQKETYLLLLVREQNDLRPPKDPPPDTEAFTEELIQAISAAEIKPLRLSEAESEGFSFSIKPLCEDGE